MTVKVSVPALPEQAIPLAVITDDKIAAITQLPHPVQQPVGEMNGPQGPEPTRYGDWETKGRCSDF